MRRTTAALIVGVVTLAGAPSITQERPAVALANSNSVPPFQSVAANPKYRHSPRWRRMHRWKRHCSQHRVRPCIHYAAAKYRQPFQDAWRVAGCESTWNPYNSYAGHYGLYQFLKSTWNTTPYAAKSYWSAKWSSLAAMWMWAHGRRGEWSCQ